MRLLTWLTVLFYIGLVVGPLAFNEFPKEIARWYLASARNAIALDEGDPEALIEKAQQWSDSTEIRIGAVEVRLRAALEDHPEDFPETFREASKQIAGLAETANVFSQLLLDSNHRVEAVETLKQYPVRRNLKSRAYVAYLNQLAYFRALASYELDEALVDIEQALSSLTATDESQLTAFLDTRAWVLHKLGRNEEALVDVNKSIALAEDWLTHLSDVLSRSRKRDKPSGKAEKDDDEQQTESESAAPTSDTDESKKSSNLSDEEKNFENASETRQALYYHRMKIHEALGNEEEALKDRTWLEQQGKDPDKEIL